MPAESLLLLLLVALCCALIALAALVAMALASGILAKALMGLLRQLYGEEIENGSRHSHDQGIQATHSKLS